MFEWSEEQLMIRDAVRQFVEAEIAPKREELEHGDLPPYDILRKLFATFGMDAMARERLQGAASSARSAIAAGEERGRRQGRRRAAGGADAVAMTMIPIIELCRYCPGMVTAMGVSMGLTVGRDHEPGHDRPEGALGARPAHAREDRRVGDHRAGLGLRRVRLDEVDGPARRRRVRPQRLEDVHHQRPLRRHDRVHLQARRGQPAGRAQDPVLRARQGHAGPRAVEAAAQDGHALVAHRRAVPHRRARRQRPAASARPRTCPPAAARAPRTRSRWSAPAWPPWRSASSSSASSCASSTPRTACSSASPSASSSSSRRSWPGWRSPASTCRTSCSATSRWRPPGAA